MATWTAEFRPYNRIDCGTSAQRSTSNTEAYRQKSTPYHIPTTQELLKKSPRGVQRGRGFTAPLRFSTASQSKKPGPLPRNPK